MSGQNDWKQICDKVQHRLQEATPRTVNKAQLLRTKIFKCLTKAHDEGILNTKLHEMHKLLKIKESKEQGKGVLEIIGGERNFKRSRDIPHFERYDKCWFDFAILVEQNPKSAEIIGFNFEIRFPEESSMQFLRFDLNLPGHNNQDRGMRFHLHPGSDDLMIHAPPMSPLEILHLFLYGLPLTRKPRAS
ncbi:MAG: hypothetical protein F6K58_25235 [Symploca sp. SIO2E9]|nr:hypothetical protein [Symploca sp. SIO2E9]